ncbi:MAG TPA: S8 family serine peptidase [Bacteroidia bacterium]|nr:S8 family serine peptidase [Bacteroidia bacterium]
MKKLIAVIILAMLAGDLFAYSKYWITFTDKNGTPFSTAAPSAFLSSRSIQRRQNQGIPVTYDDLPVNPSYVAQVLATGAVTLNYTSRWMNAISITTTDTAALSAIAALPFVSGTAPVKRLMQNSGPSEKPNDISWTGTAGERTALPAYSPGSYSYGNSYGQVHQINADCLHNMGYNGAGMIIAVLDDGFMNVNIIPAFDSIRLNNQVLGTYDFVAGTQNVYGVGGHGTMCLSDMAANLPGQMIGTAPGASYYLLRTEDANSEYLIEEDNWVAGAEYADSVGADIISTSLYYTQFDDPSQDHTYADMNGQNTIAARAATFTARVGMLTFACAGNSGTSAWFYVGTPADADSILAVGAVDASGNLASFSSRGPSYDGRIKPDISAMGLNAYVVNTSGNVTTASGTSFATPLSAGGAACLWQANPTYSAMQLRNAIRLSGDQASAPDNNKGYGIPDYCQAGILLAQEDIHAPGPSFSIFPNPNNGRTTFSCSLDAGQTGTIEIFDAMGKCVKTIQLLPGQQTAEEDLADLVAGIYFCRMTVNGNFEAEKKMIVE